MAACFGMITYLVRPTRIIATPFAFPFDERLGLLWPSHGFLCAILIITCHFFAGFQDAMLSQNLKRQAQNAPSRKAQNLNPRSFSAMEFWRLGDEIQAHVADVASADAEKEDSQEILALQKL